MKKTLLLLALLVSGLLCSQEKAINDYKYLIVPEKFDFLKEENKYDMNVLTKMVFEKYGFEVYFASQKLPDELAVDKCKALYGDLLNDSGMMNTVLYLTIKDCNGNVLFKSEKGKSKLKDYRKGYHEALRLASASLSSLNYKYSGKNIAEQATDLKGNKQGTEQLTVSPPENAVYATSNGGQLFAQPIANGYQLVDTTPKVVLKMYKTSRQDNYTAQAEGRSGVVFKKGDEWFFEYYQNDQMFSEKLNIKF
jgi:hypothetical protein